MRFVNNRKGLGKKKPEPKHYTLKDIFEAFQKEEAETCERYEIDDRLFRAVSKNFSNLLVTKMIEEGYVFNLGSNLGKLSVSKKRVNKDKLYIDYAETKKAGHTVYHLNEHSNFFYYFTRWARGKVRHIRFFRFTFISRNRKKLSQAVRDQTIKAN